MNSNTMQKVLFYKLSTVFIFLICHAALLAQDVHLSQFYAAPAYLNPAMIGSRTAPNIHLNYRSQRLTYDVPLDVGQVSMILPVVLKGIRRPMQIGSVGVSVFNMTGGPQASYNVQGAHLTAAYNVLLNRQASQMLSFGLQGGFINKRLDLAAYHWGTQYDPFVGYNELIAPSYTTLNDQALFPEFNAGVMWHYGISTNRGRQRNKIKMFAGVSASNLNRPDQSLVSEEANEAAMLVRFHGGGNFPIASQLRLMPNILVKAQEGSYSVNVGSYLSYDIGNNYRMRNSEISLMIGSWYRLQDSFIFSLGASGKRYAAGISYDMNVSNMQYNFNGMGAVEISLSFNIAKSKGSPRRFSTPLI